MSKYRTALSVYLHDQRVAICENIADEGVDSFWSMQDAPEYPFSATLIRRLAEVTGLGVKDSDYSSIGIHRSYASWPQDFNLLNLAVSIVSERMIDIRMRLSSPSEPDNEWTEEWTYSGAFTIVWKGE